MRAGRLRVFSVLAVLLVSSQSYALSSDYRVVTNAGLYGTAIGTLAGLISAPLSGNSRNIFIGSSIGLYLGLAVGLYHISHRDDPGNPLRGELAPQPRADFLPPAPGEKERDLSARGNPGAIVQVGFEVKRF